MGPNLDLAAVQGCRQKRVNGTFTQMMKYSFILIQPVRGVVIFEENDFNPIWESKPGSLAL